MKRTLLAVLGPFLLLACGARVGLDQNPQPQATPSASPPPSSHGNPLPPPEPSPEPTPPFPEPTEASGNVTNPSSVCYGQYGGSIAEPFVAPQRVIRVSANSVVLIGERSPGNDTVHAEVNGAVTTANVGQLLKKGRNAVDFVVTGEGEVHGWHAFLTVDQVVVFEQKQGELQPAFVCDDEMYRFRIFIDLE